MCKRTKYTLGNFLVGCFWVCSWDGALSALQFGMVYSMSGKIGGKWENLLWLSECQETKKCLPLVKATRRAFDLVLGHFKSTHLWNQSKSVNDSCPVKGYLWAHFWGAEFYPEPQLANNHLPVSVFLLEKSNFNMPEYSKHIVPNSQGETYSIFASAGKYVVLVFLKLMGHYRKFIVCIFVCNS